MDAWMAQMRRRARGRIATALQLGAAAPRSTASLKRREEGDDCDVIPTSAQGCVQAERKEWADWLVADPRKGKRLYYFLLTPFTK
jgi:hypothetical protein